jgi:hypothetical protein
VERLGADPRRVVASPIGQVSEWQRQVFERNTGSTGQWKPLRSLEATLTDCSPQRSRERIRRQRPTRESDAGRLATPCIGADVRLAFVSTGTSRLPVIAVRGDGKIMN